MTPTLRARGRGRARLAALGLGIALVVPVAPAVVLAAGGLFLPYRGSLCHRARMRSQWAT